MNFIDMFILNLVLVSVPLLIYMIYITTNHTKEKKEQNIFLQLAFLSSYYLITHYGLFNDEAVMLFFIGIIIFFLLLNKMYFLAVILMILNIVIYNTPGFIVIYLLILISLSIKKHFIKQFLTLYLVWFYIYRTILDKNNLETIMFVIMFLVTTYIVYIFYQKGIKVLETHLEYKELQKEKQIRLSLFKITHEIKNPVAVCKAYLDMFDVNNLEHSKKYIPILKDEINRLLVLLQDFLTMNQKNLNLDIMDVNLLIEQVIDNVSGLLKSNDITFNLNTIDDELYINGDYNRLSQVLINILKNSIEANPTNIEVNIYNIDSNLCINIKDNGCGIDKETLGRIYDPFYTTKRCGTGLGVSLSKEIINAHKGTIEYSSIKGIGTNVKITLPSYVEL